ncbi:Bug family tripartite tricarboxylate transporter substrate binding protein [Sabulicella glaciei]|uniref:Tripartite tricarboxylate transporter substrate binding protein n=1 Tax=Sabulicella glaciei TaxID=2984948 RepID=A0ABT3NT87_9PROT|nr:tripartite tricarboxylate transporter substrate binding protein [Roseococcus sp. MDT2-1-1]MCW8085371.1 tripartite tricarboxylate transporter substrate binding protein [Roseococcus sp. MDT2-1-1]
MTSRRALLAAPLMLPALARAQSSRPTRIIVPYAAGGGTDILARALAEAMRPSLPGPIVVENRAGAAGVIGSEAVARAEPDGHTLCAVVSTHVMNKHVMAQMPFDPLRDFAPVAMLSRSTFVLAAMSALPFNDIPGLRAHAEANPRSLSTGSTEALSSFIGQELARRLGIETPDVAYRAGSQLMTDIVAGHLPLGWTTTASATPHMATGRAKVIAVSTATRTPFFPDVPTAQEQGVADFDLSGWVALLGPARLPDAVAARLFSAVEAAYADGAFRQRLATLSIEADLRPPAVAAEALRREDRIWTAARAAGHIQPQ